MALADAIIRGEAIAALVSVTLDVNGAIDGISSAIKFDLVKDYQPTYAQPDAAATTSFVEFAAANGIKVQWPQVTTVLDGVTGAVKSSGSSGNADKITCAAAGVPKADREAIKALLGLPVIGVIPTGIKGDGTIEGYQYLLGTLTNFTEDSRQAETVATCAWEITGKSYTATTAGDTALAWDPGSITPVGKTAVAITALTSGDVTALKAGTVVWM